MDSIQELIQNNTYSSTRKISELDHATFSTSSYFIPKHLRKNALARYIYQKVYVKGEDCLIAVCGKRGYGKTNTAAFLAERIDCTPRGLSRFPLRKKVAVPGDFDAILPSVSYGMKSLFGFWGHMNFLKSKGDSTKGRVCIVEEAQNLFNSREYNSRKNMEALKNFLTGRTFGNIYFFTYPVFERVDIQIRELFDVLIQMQQKDTKEGFFRWKAYKLRHLGKGEYHLRFFKDYINGKKHVFAKPFRTRPPSNELMELLKIKGDLWKQAVREKRISKDGNIIMPGQPEEPKKSTKEDEKDERARKIAEQFRDRRKDFLVETGSMKGHYSKKLAGLGNDSIGLRVIHWFRLFDKEEGIKTEIPTVFHRVKAKINKL